MNCWTAIDGCTGLVIAYGVNSAQNAMMQGTTPRSPTLKNDELTERQVPSGRTIPATLPLRLAATKTKDDGGRWDFVEANIVDPLVREIEVL